MLFYRLEAHCFARAYGEGLSRSSQIVSFGFAPHVVNRADGLQKYGRDVELIQTLAQVLNFSASFREPPQGNLSVIIFLFVCLFIHFFEGYSCEVWFICHRLEQLFGSIKGLTIFFFYFGSNFITLPFTS